MDRQCMDCGAAVVVTPESMGCRCDILPWFSRETRAGEIGIIEELADFARSVDCECDSYHGHKCRRCVLLAKAGGEA